MDPWIGTAPESVTESVTTTPSATFKVFGVEKSPPRKVYVEVGVVGASWSAVTRS